MSKIEHRYEIGYDDEITGLKEQVAHSSTKEEAFCIAQDVANCDELRVYVYDTMAKKGVSDFWYFEAKEITYGFYKITQVKNHRWDITRNIPDWDCGEWLYLGNVESINEAKKLIDILENNEGSIFTKAVNKKVNTQLIDKALVLQKQNAMMLAALCELDSAIDDVTEMRRDMRRIVRKALREYNELEGK